jgi:hypothetical protein
MQHEILIPVGLDAAIKRTAEKLEADLIWLTHSYGRAFLVNERQMDGSSKRVPKVYAQKGEYENVFPNDNKQAFCFFWPVTEERPVEDIAGFNQQPVGKERTVALIFWMNLKSINPAKDYIFTEEIKRDIERVLYKCPDVHAIEKYEDEDIEKIYSGFDLDENARYKNAGTKVTQWLMYPYAGLRFELKMSYRDDC